jgi:hypothetical protein
MNIIPLDEPMDFSDIPTEELFEDMEEALKGMLRQKALLDAIMRELAKRGEQAKRRQGL